VKNPYWATLKLNLVGNKAEISLFADEVIFLAQITGILRFAQNDMTLFLVEN
jgi:hypothetical protein